MSKVDAPILFPRPASSGENLDSRPLLSELWDYPDLRKNPKLWLKMYLEGMSLHRRSLALASRATRVLDLGCGCGWFSIELARKNPQLVIDAIDTDPRVLTWGRRHLENLESKGEALARVRFSETDVDEFPWAKYEEEFDLVHAGFVLSRCKRPSEALAGIYKSLKPGGWLIYHDSTDPPSRNLNRFARFHHWFAKWRDDGSDPWNWRRHWERRYRFDPVRNRARLGDPDESEVIRRLEELFAMRFHERRRAFLDLYLNSRKRGKLRHSMSLPVVKFVDDSLCYFKLLVGATRYVLGQKR